MLTSDWSIYLFIVKLFGESRYAVHWLVDSTVLISTSYMWNQILFLSYCHLLGVVHYPLLSLLTMLPVSFIFFKLYLTVDSSIPRRLAISLLKYPSSERAKICPFWRLVSSDFFGILKRTWDFPGHALTCWGLDANFAGSQSLLQLSDMQKQVSKSNWHHPIVNESWIMSYALFGISDNWSRTMKMICFIHKFVVAGFWDITTRCWNFPWLMKCLRRNELMNN